MHVSVLCNCVFVDLCTDVVGLLLFLFCWYVCAFFFLTDMFFVQILVGGGGGGGGSKQWLCLQGF